MTRRAHGTGGLYFNRRQGYWQAKVQLATGRCVVRSRHTREEAALALDALRDEFKGLLGRMYEYPRKPGPELRRPPVSRKLRFEVMERDRFRCRYCGADADDGRLVVDHIQPVADGGTNDPSNLVTACWECNAGKGGRPLMAPLPGSASERDTA